MKYALLLTMILTQSVFSADLTGFNQLEVGNTWRYEMVYEQEPPVGFPGYKEMSGTRIITINSMDTSDIFNGCTYYFTLIDSLAVKKCDSIPDTIFSDTVIKNYWTVSKKSNDIEGGNGFFVPNDTISTDTLLKYKKNEFLGNMWCVGNINNEPKCFFVNAWDDNSGKPYIMSKQVFIQDLGLIYKWYSEATWGGFHEVFRAISFNGKKIDTKTILNILDYNSTASIDKIMQNKLNKKELITSITDKTVNITVPGAARVTLDVYNIQGQLIKRLMHEIKQTGSYSVSLDQLDCAPGVYFLKLRCGNDVETRNLTVWK